MRIEVWSDIACPFCWIGRHHLEQALAAEGLDADVVHRAFELDPTPRPSRPLLEHLHDRFGPSAPAMVQHVERMGRDAGLSFRFDQAVAANTFDAHRLVHLGRERGKERDVLEALMQAHFAQGADVADPHALRQIGREAGLTDGDVQQVLDSDRFAHSVRQEEQEARRLGITGVPFFRIDGRAGFSGARPVDAMRQALRAGG